MVFLTRTGNCSNLYFLRHGLAGQHGDPKYKDDSLRPLTAEGKKKLGLEARGMQTLGLKFDAIISSPYLRAKQTAEMVAQIYKINNKRIYLTDNLLPPASIKELLKEVHACFPKSRNVLLVGHEPHLTQMISSLLKSGSSGRTQGPPLLILKKGGLCCLSVARFSHPISAVLNWLLTPAQLELMAR